MQEAIFSMIGVIVGGVVTFLSTSILDWKIRRYERKKEEKLLICNVIKQYEILQDKMWFNDNNSEDPIEIVDYISNIFIDLRRERREKELMYISNKIMKKIEDMDNLIFPFDEPYNGKEKLKIRITIKEGIQVLRNYID